MKKQNKEHIDVENIIDSGIEKFPKPRTMPSHWDVSALTPSKEDSKIDPSDSSEIFEKFPKPRTMPMNWDTSEFKKK